LGKQCHPKTGAGREPPTVGAFLSRKNPGERALASSVSPDNPDTIAVIDAQRHAVQEQCGAAGTGDSIECDKHGS
jgi:hypothetical protein